ncbi:aminotransferase class V-fold PLP-dependent enzyme [Mucilaginibacter pocheonensis]|uniref:Probable cysteine desulfurase n=1 Tax=Mucilaginibacter pocheonensis TaxID=398050 RepID=A0ABU1TG30_9SPHI|nr:cysteine desulfurase [Mucilaginibacter pocheonensis]MDR6944312.1 cysteine desulfurase/selenocysteine lyase [Mucilaginibacter pocheonensis]
MTATLDIDKIRKDFPLLETNVYGRGLVYLDNAATTQKPLAVLNAINSYYREYNSNVHRGVHLLSQQATSAYEAARVKVAQFINAAHSHEIVFTKGTTEGINLVASGFGKEYLQPGDHILISAMEHHSNIVPWQMIAEENAAALKVIPMDDNGVLQLDALPALLTKNVKLVAVNYVSNSLGTINPVKEIIRQAHLKGIPVLIDAAQAVAHLPVDVQELDADFMAFSGHKLYGPTGIGILYGKSNWLNKLPPYQGGGDMIKTVTFEKTTYNDPPFKFEAGTPDISGAIGLAAALDYLNELGLEQIRETEHDLMQYALKMLATIDGLRFIGQAPERAGAISFLIDGLHPFDVGELLDKQGIAVRTGHHCTQPVMDFFGIPGTVRASFAFYNTKQEVDLLIAGIRKAITLLK